MVTYFNKKDLIDFGRFLLSEERTKRVNDSYREGDNQTREERLQEVYDHDFQNFVEEIKKK